MLLPVLHRSVEDGRDPAFIQAHNPKFIIGINVLRAVGPMDDKMREVIVFERGPMRPVEAPDATLRDDDRAVQFFKPLDDPPGDLDIRADFQVEIGQPALRCLIREALGILDCHLNRSRAEGTKRSR